jgi:hypothetical protein
MSVRQLRIQKARELLFGAYKGLPGERWWARPLVARDMLHWYMPSKYGLPEFQLDQYYQMQAERFKKRETMPWVSLFKKTADRVTGNKELLVEWLKTNEHDALHKDSIADLKAFLEFLSPEKEESKSERLIRKVLLPQTGRILYSEKFVPGIRRGLFVNKRHRFVDPLFRRRRLKWMERFLAGMNSAKEIKYNRHFTRHPDLQKTWPSNLGSVTVKWPNSRN